MLGASHGGRGGEGVFCGLDLEQCERASRLPSVEEVGEGGTSERIVRRKQMAMRATKMMKSRTVRMGPRERVRTSLSARSAV